MRVTAARARRARVAVESGRGRCCCCCEGVGLDARVGSSGSSCAVDRVSGGSGTGLEWTGEGTHHAVLAREHGDELKSLNSLSDERRDEDEVVDGSRVELGRVGDRAASSADVRAGNALQTSRSKVWARRWSVRRLRPAVGELAAAVWARAAGEPAGRMHAHALVAAAQLLERQHKGW